MEISTFINKLSELFSNKTNTTKEAFSIMIGADRYDVLRDAGKIVYVEKNRKQIEITKQVEIKIIKAL